MRSGHVRRAGPPRPIRRRSDPYRLADLLDCRKGRVAQVPDGLGHQISAEASGGASSLGGVPVGASRSRMMRPPAERVREAPSQAQLQTQRRTIHQERRGQQAEGRGGELSNIPISIDGTGGGDSDALAMALRLAGQTIGLAVGSSHDLIGTRRSALAQDAWPEAEADLENLIAATGELNMDQLRRLGLAGVQLEMKLSGLESAATRAAEEISGRRWRPARKWFIRFAGWLNSLLGSLLKEVPGAGEILKEFKEHLENAAADRLLEEEEAE